jgi:hypothetical protein
MQIVPVNSTALLKAFVQMPISLYANDANYIQPLSKDVLAVFNPQLNKYYKQGECKQWLLQSDGKYIGRVAAFTNKKYKQAQPTGGVGFFECINNMQAATLLLDTAKAWLQQQGMQAMDGPINFGERDRWWGLLVEGFGQPLYCMNYNPPYYQNLLEGYGFKLYYHQLCFGMDSSQDLNPRFYKWHQHYSSDPNMQLRNIDKNNLDKAAEDFCTIYNASFAGHGEGKSMDVRVVKAMFASMKAVIDPNICWFVYYNNEPIAMWINLPDLNQYFKYFKGKFGLLQKLYFLYLQRTKKINRFCGLVYGVVPQWQGKGTDALMIVDCRKYIDKTSAYQKFEMQWIGDFNPRMVNLAKNLDTSIVRKLSTYRYLFDREAEYNRHPILG